MSKLRVFLCHFSQDKPIVRELYQRLNAEGWIDPWLDEEKLLPGQDWDMEIEKAVEAADAVIVCLSKNSITKEGYVQRELKFVLEMAYEKPEGTIFIIPMRFDDCEIPRRLRSVQYLDYYPINNKDMAYGRLLNSIKLRATKVLGYIEDSQSDEFLSPENTDSSGLKVGETYTGQIVSIANSAAFVRIGNIIGVLPLIEISWDRISHPSEAFRVGDQIQVKVKVLNIEEARILLSLRELKSNPWRERVSKYQVGQIVEVVITRLTRFGVFAKLSGEIEGLIHISELSERRVEHPKELVKEGEVLKARIIRIDPEIHRIGLSIRKV